MAFLGSRQGNTNRSGAVFRANQETILVHRLLHRREARRGPSRIGHSGQSAAGFGQSCSATPSRNHFLVCSDALNHDRSGFGSIVAGAHSPATGPRLHRLTAVMK